MSDIAYGVLVPGAVFYMVRPKGNFTFDVSTNRNGNARKKEMLAEGKKRKRVKKRTREGRKRNTIDDNNNSTRS